MPYCRSALPRTLLITALLTLTPWTADAQEPPTPRPRIGLVLSGGGARGLAHVGVLKVLEAAHIPVDAVAGTSMGAIIGGLYASGMPPAQIEHELRALDWEALFANRVPRELLSQRRKEEDFEVSPALEIGLDRHTGSPMLPLGTVSSRGLELLLRRFTLPVRQVPDFDQLPIPFRAIATDMETGQPVVFRDGDLARALRASMSVPAVFAPTEVNGRILGDGGLVDNLPVDVVRAMGVDRVIAVNVGTPLSSRETLSSVLGLTAQMINILTEQNVQRSIASLDRERDVLLQPALGVLTSGDFVRAGEIVSIGEAAAQALLPQLAGLALPQAQWQAHLAARQRDAPEPGQIASVRFEGARITHPDNQFAQLASQPGAPFSVDAAERDSRLLAASGDYLHADWYLEQLPVGDGLVFAVEEKPWGPNYFRVGLELSSDFTGRGLYAIKLSHNRHWLNDHGGEWRNRLEIGTSPRWSTEWYQPLTTTEGPIGGMPFVSAYAGGESRRLDAYAPVGASAAPTEARPVGRYSRMLWDIGLDLGITWSDRGELRLGVQQLHQTIDLDLVANGTQPGRQAGREQVVRLTGVIDRLDAASFARQGWRLRAEAATGRRWLDGSLVTTPGEEAVRRLELDLTRVVSRGPHTLDATLQLRRAQQQEVQGLGRYTLGGVQRLSGYEPDQLSGNRLVFGRLTYYRRLNQQPVLTRGFFAGGTLEAGNTWHDNEAVRLNDLRWSGSTFLGADTGLGPLYLGLAWAPRLPGMSVYLKLGRP